MTTSAVQLIPAAPIDEAYEYSLLVEKGRIARQAKDMSQWLLGDYVRMLITHYGERTIEQYADDIEIEAHSLYTYGPMASYYPLQVREELSELDLCYTHFKEARRLKSLDKSIEFLKTIAENRWTVNQTRMALKALRMKGHAVAENVSDAPPMTDLRNLPYERRPSYQWRGPAMVSIDKQGNVSLKCDSPPEIEPGKRYIVSFEEVEI